MCFLYLEASKPKILVEVLSQNQETLFLCLRCFYCGLKCGQQPEWVFRGNSGEVLDLYEELTQADPPN